MCVKVDREERPDLDDVYMAAVQITTGRGGWPMSVLPPARRAPVPRADLPARRPTSSRRRARIQAAGSDERARLVEVADEEIATGRGRAVGRARACPPSTATTPTSCASPSSDASRSVRSRARRVRPRPEVPAARDTCSPSSTGDGSAGGAAGLAMARKTLDAMAAGGVYDQVGGGFHRYSTDAVWLVPHFEKMLYDNALLATAYALAFAASRRTRGTPRSCAETLAWIEREMAVEGGGYASSLDADTEGEEGLTYTWTPAELRAALPDGRRRASPTTSTASRAEGQLPRRGERRAHGPQHPPPSQRRSPTRGAAALTLARRRGRRPPPHPRATCSRPARSARSPAATGR